MEDFYRSICTPQGMCCVERCRFLALLGGKGDTPAGRQGQDKGCAGLLKVSTPKESR